MTQDRKPTAAEIHSVFAEMGRRGGASKSAAKAAAVRENGAKGGRKIKIHLTSSTLDRMAAEARSEAEAGVSPQDWDAIRECKRVSKIANELGEVKRCADGRIELTRDAFDWVLASLDRICESYHGGGVE